MEKLSDILKREIPKIMADKKAGKVKYDSKITTADLHEWERSAAGIWR